MFRLCVVRYACNAVVGFCNIIILQQLLYKVSFVCSGVLVVCGCIQFYSAEFYLLVRVHFSNAFSVHGT